MKYNLNEYDFEELGALMDGGSITLYFKNNENKELIIDLQQFVITEYYEEISKIPGRVYLNNEIVEKRSSTETEIINFLRCNILHKLYGLEKEILIEKIRWIESKDYIDFSPIKNKLSESRKKELEIKTGKN
ncbi:hypothetical protein [Aquimarina sediminis]|uniref:hypothetical protein n=1 Tax=Aquimarina sediminis TaxID=2070536 RepID=UPI000CA08EDF|nr:hypothetical protein [Aquimarina sediminis]